MGGLILHLILCFSLGSASGRFLERDMLACLLNVWEYIWKSHSEMSHCSISLAFLILALSGIHLSTECVQIMSKALITLETREVAAPWDEEPLM